MLIIYSNYNIWVCWVKGNILIFPVSFLKIFLFQRECEWGNGGREGEGEGERDRDY